MNIVDIERRSCAGGADLTEFLAPETRRPVILTDAFDHWPARRKWSWDFFGTYCREDAGTLRLSFSNGGPMLLTRVGEFIERLDQPLDAISGFWLDGFSNPASEPPEMGSGSSWSFGWHTFSLHPELRDDISPFPAQVPNLLAKLSDGMLGVLESICDIETSTIYLSRKGSIAPFHVNFFHTFGSLFQFKGRKKVWLIAPTPGLDDIPESFDPEHFDPDGFPALAEAVLHHATLEPGQCLLMPPDWWHFVRAIDHSMTLSCNFFNEYNMSDFLPCVFKAALESDRGDHYLGKLNQLIEQKHAAGALPGLSGDGERP